jgi:hypothetical protein
MTRPMSGIQQVCQMLTTIREIGKSEHKITEAISPKDHTSRPPASFLVCPLGYILGGLNSKSPRALRADQKGI